MIKAAFFDVDGTFYSHKIHGVPESNLKALEALKSKGIKTFLATGRHFEELEDLGMDGIAFGDGENDLDMIQFAGIGVAMGNAVAETKAVADYVTTAIDDNGIWNACKHFGLI